MNSIKSTLRSCINFVVYSAGVVALLIAAAGVVGYWQARPFLEWEHAQNNKDSTTTEQVCIDYLDKLAAKRADGAER